MKVLHINASPRDAESRSLGLAEFFIEELQQQTQLELDRFDLFSKDLPEFGALAVGAKMALFSGTEATAEQKQTWMGIKAVFDRFAAADLYVINTPLWNNGLPYVLKQFIDVVTQPGWAFGFDIEKGYSGLLADKKACVIHASGVYKEGRPPSFGSDFSTPYLADWLRFIGIQDIQQIHFSPTVVNPDVELTKNQVERRAVEVASHFLKSQPKKRGAGFPSHGLI